MAALGFRANANEPRVGGAELVGGGLVESVEGGELGDGLLVGAWGQRRGGASATVASAGGLGAVGGRAGDVGVAGVDATLEQPESARCQCPS